MSSKEMRRGGVLERVKSGELKLVNAAVMMGMSYRQGKRMAKRYREGGAKGLQHGSAGRESNRRKPQRFRERVLRLVGKKYSGEEGERFEPTLAAEHLASDDHVEVNVQTLRRWMLSEGLWSRARKRRKHRQRRERKEHVRGTDADGWKFPPLVGGTRAARVFGEHGRRRQRRYAGRDGQ
jgi:transposase